MGYEGRKAMAFALKKSLNAFKLAEFILSYQLPGKMPLKDIYSICIIWHTVRKYLKCGIYYQHLNSIKIMKFLLRF